VVEMLAEVARRAVVRDGDTALGVLAMVVAIGSLGLVGVGIFGRRGRSSLASVTFAVAVFLVLVGLLFGLNALMTEG
jgi:hypothetical protein